MFDFEKGDWPDGMRVTYAMTKWIIADASYQYCQNVYNQIKRFNRGWLEREHESVWAWEQESALFDLPIEKLMFEVVLVVFAAGRAGKEFEMERYNEISDILKKNDLSSMLELLPEVERREFEYDLRLLGILT